MVMLRRKTSATLPYPSSTSPAMRSGDTLTLRTTVLPRYSTRSAVQPVRSLATDRGMRSVVGDGSCAAIDPTGNDEPSSRSSRDRTVNTGSAADLLRWRQARRSFDLRPSRQRTHQHRRGASASTSSKPGCRSSCSTQQFSVAKEDVAQQGSPTGVRIGLRRTGDPCPGWPP